MQIINVVLLSFAVLSAVTGTRLALKRDMPNTAICGMTLTMLFLAVLLNGLAT